jgi:hypothetical protein
MARALTPSLFGRLGHAIIVLRKLRQWSATGRIGEAIGQRSTFLSTTVPTLRTCQGRLCLIVVLIPIGYACPWRPSSPIAESDFRYTQDCLSEALANSAHFIHSPHGGCGQMRALLATG